LVKAMAESGLPLEQMFKRVITGVKAETHGQQQPWSEASIQGDFYFHAVPADASPRREQPISAAQSPASIHVPTAAELDESYWLAIKNSTDAADFAGYTKSFPTGMHLAESQMMMRRLSRSTTATAISHDAAAANPLSASTLSLRPGGPYPGWATTSLIPGFIGRGSVIVNRDGTIDTQAPDGTTTHTTVIIIDPDNITGTQITHLGKLRGLQNRYPDGTTSTQVTLQGRLIDGVLSGTWYDKFQNGQFQWTVGGTK